MRRSKNQPGFTFVELLFAIVVMGILFSIALVVFIGMLRFYVFAGSVRQNQENGRNVLDTINRDIRFAQLVFPSQTGIEANKVCYYNPSTKKIVGYYSNPATLGTSTANLQKFESTSTYDTYDAAKLASADCADSTKGTLSSNLPKSMYPTDFVVMRTGGAIVTTYSNVTAITIKFGFITQTAGTISSSCDVRNIYCNKNTYNTALELRGNILP